MKSNALQTRLFGIAVTAIIALLMIACEDEEKTYAIGDIGPGGGVVFYDKKSVSDGWRYLEAAPHDQATSVKWANANSSINNKAYGTAIGTGKANTAAIITARGNLDNATNNAAIAASVTINGKSDWFLPSRDELGRMYNARSHLGIQSGNYWSSSMFYDNIAYGLDFGGTGMGDTTFTAPKSNAYRVRAIRAF